MMTREERAHRRLTFARQLARNAIGPHHGKAILAISGLPRRLLDYLSNLEPKRTAA
ncbi:MAG: hypothetical protein HYV63_16210 [Candidatus Schekmanbacteria bacterium]|nr:hypothetical protein [Candidatus Schekmanbacteria bacterium]